MRPTKGILITAIFAALGLIAGDFAPAQAGDCAASTTCTIELTVANVTQLSPIDVRVTWINTANTTEFDVQWISGGPGTPKFISEFGYNDATAVSKVTYNGADVTSFWGLSGGKAPFQIDGFGKFLSDYQTNQSNGGDEGIAFPIKFFLAGLVTTIPLTDANTEFVVHVGGYANGCSGFVGETGSTPSNPSSNPLCGATVAEPGTVGALALLGFGLVSAGAVLRRRWFRHEA